MKAINVCLLLLTLIVSNQADVMANKTTKPKPKKIIILTSKGGNGHTAACTVLKDVLSDFDVKAVNAFTDVIHSFDFIKTISFGKMDGEGLYNYWLREGWNNTINFVAHYPAPFIFNWNQKNYEKQFIKFLEQEKPDLLISIMPLINAPAYNAAQHCKIPFLLITLDADLTLWLQGFKKPTYPNFRLGVGTLTPRISKQLASKKIPQKNLRITGNPIRKDFFEPKNKEKILADWHLPTNKPIAMLMRGGTGSEKLVAYAKKLLKLNTPLHLLVCIGRNEGLVPKLKKLKETKNVSFSIVPFTNRISDLMAVSTLLITPPSPNVCNEAMSCGLSILIDTSSTCVFWERATIDLVKEYGNGTMFNSMSKLNKLVEAQLEQKHVTKKNRHDFNASIKNIVSELIGPKKNKKIVTANNKTDESLYYLTTQGLQV